jgi:EAL domain-containing protein (putative c-di-GMP-specific phosphodiesterase class I)
LQLKRPEFITGIKTLLEESSLLPCYLELELTESILAKEHDLIISALRELREMGMDISIDDFGTGYSNFLYLKQFNVTKLKIDQSFVADMNRNKEVKTIVETMVKFAGALNLSTIAEGVETAEQLETLAEFGCDEIQGYYFSRPLPPEEFERYYESINGSPALQ